MTVVKKVRPRLTVAVCGGGIAGLALASFLSEAHDVRIDVYESKHEIRTVGAGIAVWKRYWDLLSKYHNIEEECIAHGIAPPVWSQVTGPTLRKSDVSQGFDFFTLGVGPMVLPRTILLDILYKRSSRADCQIHTDAQFLDYSFPDDGSPGLRLNFKNRPSEKVDLLIGADGVHSRVRQTMFAKIPAYKEPHFSGQFAYRMSCTRAKLKGLDPGNEALKGFKIWCGKGRHVTSNAVADLIQVTAYDNVSVEASCFASGYAPPLPQNSWVEETSAWQVSQRYQGWEPDLTTLLACMDASSRWAVHTIDTKLPTFVSVLGPGVAVALVGDAAHAMTPHQGLGGGQGVEDAYILAAILENPLVTRETLAQAVQVYDDVRRPAAQEVAKRSLICGHIYAGLHKGLSDEQGNPMYEEVGIDLRDGCQWLINNKGCEIHKHEALKMLDSKIRTTS